MSRLFKKSSKHSRKSSTEGVGKLTAIPSDTSMHASLTLSKVNLCQHSEWNSVITKLIELKITPEDALRILKKRKKQPNTVKTTAHKPQKHDLPNQSDNLTKRKTIIAEFTVTVDLINVPDEINLKHKIKFEVVNNYNSGKVVKSEYKTTLIPSIENIIKMSDHKSSISKPEIGESIKNVFPSLSDQNITLNQNPVIGLKAFKDHQNSCIICPENEYNILLLGEIGVGKSTFINAFANYIKYRDFKTAQKNNIVQLIPSKFTLPDPATGEPIMINSGMKDENERTDIDGTSSTKAPMSYTFQLQDRTLRIIDTPGIGDINGINTDRENFDQILAHLNKYNEFHCILLLIRESATCKTTFFSYCITELLTHLHQSASKNLIFCFTFSRNSFFGPGEGFAILKSFLENELKDVPLKLKPGENCFFIDNEAYRFLVAQKQGYKFNVKQEASYKESWNNSVEQSNKMWERVTRTVPHKLENTILFNNARKLILEIAEPMIRLQTMIQSYISQIEAGKDSLKNPSKDNEELKKQMYLNVDDLVAEQLDYPNTVCASGTCTDVVKFKGVDNVNYKTICHPHCSCILDDTPLNAVGHPRLKSCSVMNDRLLCSVCGCSWQKHMHIIAKYTKVKLTIIDNRIKVEIKTNEEALKGVDEAIQIMENIITEYEDELKIITDICTKFEVFLINNSNFTHNTFIGPYLDRLMDEEIKKIESVSSYSRSKYESLQQMKDTHQKNVQIIEDAIKSNEEKPVQLNDIFRYKNLLFGLKHTGAKLREIIETGSSASKKSLEEELIDLTNFITGSISSTSVPTTLIPEFNSNNRSNVNNNDNNKKGFWRQFWLFE